MAFGYTVPAPLKLAFFGLIMCLAVVISWSTGFDSVDDHLFLNTLGSGYLLKSSDVSPVESGRFDPLNGIAYNLLLPFSGKVLPRSLHIFNALEFLAFCVVLYKVLELLVNPLTACIGSIIFLLQPSFLAAANRLLVPERTAILALLGALYFYNSYSLNRSAGAFVACLSLANWALYSKEPICGALAVFACCQLFFGRTRRPATRLLDFGLLASSATFVVVYFLLVLPHHNQSYATARRFLPWFANFFQNIREYGLFSDPFLFFVGIPLTAVRLKTIVRSGLDSFHWSDSALFAGLAYAGSMLLLNMSYTSYYLLPASAMAWPAMVRFAQQFAPHASVKLAGISLFALVLLCAAPSQISGRFLIPLVLAIIVTAGLISGKPSTLAFAGSLAVFSFLLNSLPGSVDTVAVLKSRPLVYGQMMRDLARRLQVRGKARQNIFVAGMSASAGIESFMSLEHNLTFLGFKPPSYDLCSCTPPEGAVYTVEDSQFTVYRDKKPQAPRSGDLIVFSSGELHPCEVQNLDAVTTSDSRVLTSVAPSLDEIIQRLKARLLRRSQPAGFGPPQAMSVAVVR